MEQDVSPGVKRRALMGISLTALFAALISAGAFIVIPLKPVPIVLQNLFTLLAGMLLGPLRGGAAVGLFILAGAVGIPVFASNGSPMGIARIIGPTGGYLFGYLLGAAAAGLILGRPRPGLRTPVWKIILAVLAGTLVVYIPGLFRLKMILKADWNIVLAAGLYPFLPGDLVKGLIAALVCPRLRRTAADYLD